MNLIEKTNFLNLNIYFFEYIILNKHLIIYKYLFNKKKIKKELNQINGFYIK